MIRKGVFICMTDSIQHSNHTTLIPAAPENGKDPSVCLYERLNFSTITVPPSFRHKLKTKKKNDIGYISYFPDTYTNRLDQEHYLKITAPITYYQLSEKQTIQCKTTYPCHECRHKFPISPILLLLTFGTPTKITQLLTH